MQVCPAPKFQGIFVCKHDNYCTLSEIHRTITLHWCRWWGFGTRRTEVVACGIAPSWTQAGSRTDPLQSTAECMAEVGGVSGKTCLRKERNHQSERSEGGWWQRVSNSKENTEFREGKLQKKLLKAQELSMPTCRKSSECGGGQEWVNFSLSFSWQGLLTGYCAKCHSSAITSSVVQQMSKIKLCKNRIHKQSYGRLKCSLIFL